MILKHSVHDQDKHFILDPVTRTWSNVVVQKPILIQGDHNSEVFTFQLPRLIEGHDMSQCDTVRVHYINIDAVTREQSPGVYEVEDLRVNPDDKETIICSWRISHNATKYAGSLSFLLRFACSQEGGTEGYVWHSAIDSSAVVAKGIDSGSVVMTAPPDILAQWKAELMAGVVRTVNGIAPDEHGNVAVNGAEGGHGSGGKPVTAYGAKGDGKTDDTAAFKNALAENRIVFVPGGTYKLTSGITIGDNCCLELAQDAVLNFTSTTGNCITLGMLSNLKGNHATIKVPYEFSGNVLYAYSNDHTDDERIAVPPFTQWDPQWKAGRYVTDVNICKADSRGFHYAVEPTDCKGAAVYVSADNTLDMLTFMWGVHYSGLRIAGAFAYGIHCKNIDDGWNHEMRIDAFIDACEVGVQLEHCNQVYVSATVQPRRAYSIDEVYAPYAKHGIKLVNSKNVDLSGSRVWDWDANKTLWTDGGEYQSYAMIGDCTGAILNDFSYHTQGDTRKRIYTDNDRNFETLTILQEPIDRWFKVIGGDPYFSNGIANTKLLTAKALDLFIYIDAVKSYTDVLENATEADDTTIFNEIGYQVGKRFVSLGSGTDLTDSSYYMTTGFIKIQRGQTLYGKDLTLDDTAKGYAGIVYYNANHERFGSATAATALKNDGYWTANYQSTGTSFSIQFPAGETLKNLAYVRLVFPMTCVGKSPSMAIDETMEATYEGFLSDGIKVKGENVIGEIGVKTPDWVATKEEHGGDTVVIAEQTLSSMIWNNRQWDIIPGITYEVYINGTRYTCTAFELDGGVALGNNTSLNMNDYPFCIFWSGNGPSGFFYKNNTLTFPLNLKVTDAIVGIYNKMPPEYLPDGVAMLDDIPEGGGTSIDVTAEVGQTIVVEEVDGNGKPTKWKAAGYQPRTHWSEYARTVLIDNETFPEGASDLLPFFLVEGQIYTVVFNGVSYERVAKSFEVEGVAFIGIGNLAEQIGEDTGEPFVVLTAPQVGSSTNSVDYTAFTMSLTTNQETVHKIPVKYMPDEISAYAPYYLLLLGYDVGGDQFYEVMSTVSMVETAIESGRQIIAKAITPDGKSYALLPLMTVTNVEGNEHGKLLGFHLSAGTMLTLVPNADGLYDNVRT